VEVYRKRKGLEGESIMRERLVVDREEPLVAELRSFVDYVRNRKRPLVTGEEGREALRVALMIMRAIKAHSRKWRFPDA